ncbi:MAG: bifunctional pyr operon transcriptional regulator/uracil phosphoribosyltransferase PyrR [Anaerorhabdus sp.]
MKEIINEIGISRSLIRIAHEIVEKNKGCENIVLIGIKTRGIILANRIASLINEFEDGKVLVGEVDVSYWRDDEKKKKDNIPDLAISTINKIVILVDDVLYSGRTIRAAMDGITFYGRPKQIQLAVLVDRGHRELPIRADYVGKNLPTSKEEEVLVKMREIDGVDQICLG